MGGIMSCIGGCFSICMCEGARSCCKGCEEHSKPNSKGPYLIVFMVMTLFAIIGRFLGRDILVKLYFFDVSVCESQRCMGYNAVLRISFVLAIFFFVQLLLFNAAKMHSWHQYHWFVKCLLLVGGIIGTFFIPNDFFQTYAWFCLFASLLFVLLQIVVLIDWAYRINELWINEQVQEVKKAMGTTLFCGVLFIVGIVLEYAYFGGNDCTSNTAMITFCIILSVAVFMLSLSSYAEFGSILPSAFVAVYGVWTLYTAMTSDPSSCNPFQSNGTFQLLGSLALMIGSILYGAWTLSKNTHIFGPADDIDSEASDYVEQQDEEAVDQDSNGNILTSKDDLDEVDRHRQREADARADEGDDGVIMIPRHIAENTRFYWMMLISAMYMGMLLTNWSLDQEDATNNREADRSETSYWVKMCSFMATYILYAWTLVAPTLCGDRDFSGDDGL